MFRVWFTIFWVTKNPPGYDWVVNMSPMWSPAPVSKGKTFTFQNLQSRWLNLHFEKLIRLDHFLLNFDHIDANYLQIVIY